MPKFTIMEKRWSILTAGHTVMKEYRVETILQLMEKEVIRLEENRLPTSVLLKNEILQLN